MESSSTRNEGSILIILHRHTHTQNKTCVTFILITTRSRENAARSLKRGNCKEVIPHTRTQKIIINAAWGNQLRSFYTHKCVVVLHRANRAPPALRVMYGRATKLRNFPGKTIVVSGKEKPQATNHTKAGWYIDFEHPTHRTRLGRVSFIDATRWSEFARHSFCEQQRQKSSFCAFEHVLWSHVSIIGIQAQYSLSYQHKASLNRNISLLKTPFCTSGSGVELY